MIMMGGGLAAGAATLTCTGRSFGREPGQGISFLPCSLTIGTCWGYSIVDLMLFILTICHGTVHYVVLA
jgi:hypothetical protein